MKNKGNYTDPLYFRDDLTKAYAKGRKNMPVHEADDLLRCLIKFLKQDMPQEKHYAYKIPSMGVLYKTFESEQEGRGVETQNKRLNDMLIDIYRCNQYCLLTRKPLAERWYPDKTLEEIQAHQNNS